LLILIRSVSRIGFWGAGESTADFPIWSLKTVVFLPALIQSSVVGIFYRAGGFGATFGTFSGWGPGEKNRARGHSRARKKQTSMGSTHLGGENFFFRYPSPGNPRPHQKKPSIRAPTSGCLGAGHCQKKKRLGGAGRLFWVDRRPNTKLRRRNGAAWRADKRRFPRAPRAVSKGGAPSTK